MNVTNWKGFISHQNIEAYPSQWLKEWRKVAKEANANNKDLLVFEIPRDKTGCNSLGLISSIQKHIEFMIKIEVAIQKHNASKG